MLAIMAIVRIMTVLRRTHLYMKRAIRSTSILAALLLFVAAIPAFAADPAKVAGDWSFTIESPNGTGTPSATFKQDGENLTGTYKGRFGESPLKGTIKGNEIKFTTSITTPNGDIQLEYSGTVDGDSMKGTVAFGSMGQGSFTGKRKAADAPAPK
jgi:hypothetical protein